MGALFTLAAVTKIGSDGSNPFIHKKTLQKQRLLP
jgi:hypothetical protein